MGEIADHYVGQFYEDYGGWAHDEEAPHIRPAPSPVTCKHCGTGGLYWNETSNGWRLIRGGKLHTCTPDVAHLFDVIEEEN